MQPKEWDVVAKDYFNEVTSPFSKGVKNPLFEDLEKIKDKKKQSLIDLGCGIGNLVPYVEKFGKVSCLDFSPGMIKQARLQHGNKSHINFHEKDITELKEFHNNYDVAIAINSFIMPDLKKVTKSFEEAFHVLKKKGKFYGIFPAMEAVAYQFLLSYEDYEKKYKNEKKAYKKANEDLNLEGYDFGLGILAESGFQKHYYRQGIRHRLKKAGFKNIEFKRVEYPWEMTILPNPLRFKEEDPMWDWYVTAEK